MIPDVLCPLSTLLHMGECKCSGNTPPNERGDKIPVTAHHHRLTLFVNINVMIHETIMSTSVRVNERCVCGAHDIIVICKN